MKIVLSAEQIQKRVKALGAEISVAYGEKDLVVVGVLKGAFVFMADLVRHITVPLTCEFLRVSSYRDNRSTGTVHIDFDVTQPIEGKDVLLVEDIVDTGHTLRYLLEHLRGKKPASLKICSLLYKENDPALRKQIDFLGFTIPNRYVVGYGLDSEGEHRALPHLATLS